MSKAEVRRRLVRLQRWSYLTLFGVLLGWVPGLALCDAHNYAVGLPLVAGYVAVLIVHCLLASKWWANFNDIAGRLGR